MTPIEKIRSRTDALSTLGLDETASPRDLRDAWKRRARETHPDRPEGRLEDFLDARAAFEALNGTRSDIHRDSHRPMPQKPARPAIKPRPQVGERRQQIPAEVVAEARAHLEAHALQGSTDHVAEAMLRSGRSLVFLVPSPAATGRNRIALPTEVLSRLKPGPVAIFPVDFGDAAAPDQFPLPVSTVESFFPGARDVTIRFAARASDGD